MVIGLRLSIVHKTIAVLGLRNWLLKWVLLWCFHHNAIWGVKTSCRHRQSLLENRFVNMWKLERNIGEKLKIGSFTTSQWEVPTRQNHYILSSSMECIPQQKFMISDRAKIEWEKSFDWKTRTDIWWQRFAAISIFMVPWGICSRHVQYVHASHAGLMSTSPKDSKLT